MVEIYIKEGRRKR